MSDPGAAIGDADLLEPDERLAILETWLDTQYPVDPTATLVSMFEAGARRSPNAVAVSFEDRELSYTEFAGRVHRLARHLIGLGVGPETVIGLGMRRSLDLVVGMYAVVAAGAAYLPVDRTIPRIALPTSWRPPRRLTC